eukprot:9472900-Pyramimonas_sp.AAC.1
MRGGPGRQRPTHQTSFQTYVRDHIDIHVFISSSAAAGYSRDGAQPAPCAHRGGWRALPCRRER